MCGVKCILEILNIITSINILGRMRDTKGCAARENVVRFCECSFCHRKLSSLYAIRNEYELCGQRCVCTVYLLLNLKFIIGNK